MPLVNVTMAKGRTNEQKKVMMHAVCDAMVNTLGVSRDSVRVWINEVENTEFLAGSEVLVDKQARLAAERAEAVKSQEVSDGQ